MSAPLHAWYTNGDLGALGERQATLKGEIELGRLPRLRELLAADSGILRASLRFRQRRSGYVAIELQYETTLQLQCQRCLEPFSHHMSGCVTMALMETAAIEPYVPEGYEPVLLEGERLMPAVLIEDELIVSLPLVPRHDRIEDCGSLAQRLGAFSCEGDGPLDSRPTQSSH